MASVARPFASLEHTTSSKLRAGRIVRPTFKAVWLAILGIPLSVLVIFWPWLWALSAAYIASLLVLLALDLLLILPANKLSLRPRTPATLAIGTQGALEVRLRVLSKPRPMSYEAVADLDARFAPQPLASVRAASGDDALLSIALKPFRRGQLMVLNLWLRWSGPLGLVRRHQCYGLEHLVAVVPGVRATSAAALRFRAHDARAGSKLQSTRGVGTEFASLRDYTAGLDHRAIDWKHSARHRRLVCKEFETEHNHPVVLAFDTGYLMSERVDGIPKLDHTINAGLLLGYVCLSMGDRVGLLGFDSRIKLYVPPSSGAQTFASLERAATRLDYGRHETNFALALAELGARLSRRTLIVIHTEFVDTTSANILLDHLRPLARKHLIVFLVLRDLMLSKVFETPPARPSDIVRTVIANDFIIERKTVLNRLGRMGVHCVEANPRQASIGLLNRYLDIKQRGLV